MSEFKPSFQNVFMSGLGLPFQAYNPLYCATEQTAKDLKDKLKLDCTITHLPPVVGFRGFVMGTEDKAGVPYFAFSNGALCNTGLCASYWMHGWSDEVAERMCRLDIANQIAYVDALSA